MKASERHTGEQGLRLKHDAELRSIAVLRRSELEPELVSSAKAELVRRHLPVPTPEEYWRDRPQEWLAAVGFCYPCWEQTTSEPARGSTTIERFGIGLTGEVDRCPTCSSVIATKALWLGAPLIPLAQYRVIRSAGGAYRGRKLKTQ
ncbi:MAG: hypothetical protein ABUL62_22360 [Myxococcales bacterium]|jgi:hypothetical protein